MQSEPERPHVLRYLQLLKNQIKLDKEIEIQKEILFANHYFNSLDAFKYLDREQKGRITFDDLLEVIGNGQ